MALALNHGEPCEDPTFATVNCPADILSEFRRTGRGGCPLRRAEHANCATLEQVLLPSISASKKFWSYHPPTFNFAMILESAC